jgi:alkanesulfonate monooxygenase SsuD/methylene tetrahydromethanopterin reductase-like flavin-dependent oxidoreductase (luciferase family)
MRVGLFLDLRNPPAWAQPWDRVYGRMLEHLEDADARGVGSVWLSEHHLFEDGYLPQPLTFAAAIAARTQRLRIGTAILQAPLRPAIDIAEQAAVVDILSGGRLELGLGAGYRIPEWQIWGTDGSRRYDLLDERIAEVRRLWGSGGCTPPPLQEHPPLWVGCEGPRGARIAGRRGEGLLNLKDELLPPYREALAAAGHDPASARMGGCVNLFLADDPEAAWPRIAPHLRYQWQSYEDYAVEGYGREPRTVDPEILRTKRKPQLPWFDVVTPEEAIERMRAWLDPLPVAHVYLWATIAGLDDDLVSRHIELVGSALAPAFSDSEVNA